MQCDKPPCLHVCPTAATFRRPDGIIEINHRRCIGCGYCIVSCPYMARVIIFQKEFGAQGSELRGVSSKCNFCIHRVDAGLKQGLRPGIDGDASPFCVISCSSGALSFGDLDDPESLVSRLVSDGRTVALQEELKTDRLSAISWNKRMDKARSATIGELIQPMS
jgi:phenylacetyl-CoA:acceptor oxidoreductase subunit 1